MIPARLEESVRKGFPCKASGAQGRGTYQVAYETVGHLVNTFAWLERSVRKSLLAGDFIRSLAELAACKAQVRFKWPTKR